MHYPVVFEIVAIPLILLYVHIAQVHCQNATVSKKPSGPFQCFRCEHCDQTVAMEPCPVGVSGCVTIRVSRSQIRMDCFTNEIEQQFCDVQRLANGTCEYCDGAWGCNGRRQDPLICRSCDWTKDGDCDVPKVCRVPFRSQTPMCYVLFRHPQGFHFGCLDDMSPAIEQLMYRDPYRLTHHLCDSNECNAHAKDFWPIWEALLQPIRVCHVCFPETNYCGPKVCSLDSIYGHFCLRTFDNAVVQCLSDVENLFLSRFIDTDREYICGEDNCQQGTVNATYQCSTETGSKENVYSIRDGCALIKLPNNTIYRLGRLSKHPCTSRRCLICRSNNCGDLVKSGSRLVCYHSSAPAGDYIREQQLDYLEMCQNAADLCSTQTLTDGTVKRGCAPKTAADETTILCGTHKCNRAMEGIYCYTCRRTDPNCVFSQHEGPFEMCREPALGCYVRLFDDNSVSRGCAFQRSDNQTLANVYHFCDDKSLCNGQTMRSHSCHILQLSKDFRAPVQLPQGFQRDATEAGWLFESCADIDGLPACYLKVDRHQLHYGCTADLTRYELVNYRRGSLLPALIFCDGHYCNELPERRASRKRVIWSERPGDLSEP